MTVLPPVRSKPSICVAILAAGQSRRFGDADKLVQPLNGKLLGLHVCDALQPLSFTESVVITSAEDHPCVPEWHKRGFATLVNAKAAEGLGTSVALAANWAAQKMADALLICLADMPFVPTAHFERLVSAFSQSDENSVIASCSGQIVSPPAIFGKGNFTSMGNLTGSRGAQELLARAEKLPITADFLLDIDTHAQLQQANRRDRSIPGL